MFFIDAGAPEAQISLIVLFILGSMVGVLGGFFGVGGGWIITPTLHILGMPMSYAVGTGLAYIMGMSFVAFAQHRSADVVEYVPGFIVGGAMILGLWSGSLAVIAMEASGSAGTADFVIRTVYIIFLFSLGIFMFIDCCGEKGRSVASVKECGDGESKPPRHLIKAKPAIYLKRSGFKVSLWLMLAIGLAIGFFSGLLGAGGGFLLVPALFYLVGAPTVTAVGPSLLCILIASPFGVAAYAIQGRVNWIAAAAMLAGVILAAPLGARAAHIVRGVRLRFLYSLMVLSGGLSVILKELDTRVESQFITYGSKTLIFAAGGGIVLAIGVMWFLAARSSRDRV